MYLNNEILYLPGADFETNVNQAFQSRILQKLVSEAGDRIWMREILMTQSSHTDV